MNKMKSNLKKIYVLFIYLNLYLKSSLNAFYYVLICVCENGDDTFDTQL